MQKILFIILLILTVRSGIAQTNCDDLVFNALQMYKEGLYDDVVRELEGNFHTCKLSRQDKVEALKLLAAANYALDELELGDDYMRDFFKKAPNYIPQRGKDPVKFIEAYPKFKISPKFTLHMQAGVPSYQVYRTKIYPLWDQADYTQPYTTNSFPWLTAGFQWYPVRNFFLKTGVGYTQFTYKREIEAEEQIRINYREENKILIIPVELGIDFPVNKKFYPSIYLGVTLQNILESQADVSLDYLGDVNVSKPPQINGADMLPQRNEANANIDLGIRLNYKVNNFIFFADFSHSETVLEHTNGEKFENIGLISDFYYMDDDFSVGKNSITFGISFILFSHVKLKY